MRGKVREKEGEKIETSGWMLGTAVKNK